MRKRKRQIGQPHRRGKTRRVYDEAEPMLFRNHFVNQPNRQAGYYKKYLRLERYPQKQPHEGEQPFALYDAADDEHRKHAGKRVRLPPYTAIAHQGGAKQVQPRHAQGGNFLHMLARRSVKHICRQQKLRRKNQPVHDAIRYMRYVRNAAQPRAEEQKQRRHRHFVGIVKTVNAVLQYPLPPRIVGIQIVVVFDQTAEQYTYHRRRGEHDRQSPPAGGIARVRIRIAIDEGASRRIQRKTRNRCDKYPYI